MVDMDVKKLGKNPDGGGWRAHGRSSEEARASKRAHRQKVGCTYLHSMIDGYSRLAYTEALEMRRPSPSSTATGCSSSSM